MEEDYKTKIALLERDMSQVNTFIEKLDSAIEKIGDVSASIKELLAIHDHKLKLQTQVNDDIFKVIHEMKKENHQDHESVQITINALSVRVASLERWKYTMVGGAFAVGCIITFIIDISKLL
jgi:hypothetical protein